LSPVAPKGRLALTGHATKPSSVPTFFPGRDVFLLLVSPISLAPIPNTAELFGEDDDQEGVSLADHAGGFIIAGTKKDDSNDPPEDLYLINTDGNGETTCSRDWKVKSEVTNFQAVLISLAPTPFLSEAEPPVFPLLRNIRRKVCVP